jgi:hypothetical protein
LLMDVMEKWNVTIWKYYFMKNHSKA